MPGGRSLVNNSIFNLVLMLAGFSPTSSPSFPPSSALSYVFVLPRRRFLPRTLSSFLFFYLFFALFSFVGTYPAVSTSR